MIKYITQSILLICLTICMTVSVIAQPIGISSGAAEAIGQPSLIPSPPDLKVKAYVLMDANSGKILAQKNMDEQLPPASLTKMMTMYVISQALQNGSIKIDDPVRISKKAWKTEGSKMFIRVGSLVPVKALIQGIIVDSGNDACVAMSEHVAGTEDAFVQLMNTEAKRLGLNSTNYEDCTGLPKPNHLTTAKDLAVLARAIILDFPQDYKWYSQKWFTYNKIRQPNRNRLLWRYNGTDGIKTGHASSAGYCLVTSAKRNGMRLISVILGAKTDESRASNSIALLNYGFRFYSSHLVYQAGSTITQPRIWFGKDKTIPAGVQQDLYVTTPSGQFQKIKTKIEPNSEIKAPIKKGQTIGSMTITLNGQLLETAPLVALSTVEKGGIWRRSIDHIAHLFHGWFGGGDKKVHHKPAKMQTTKTAT